jgi:hypothetical protein
MYGREVTAVTTTFFCHKFMVRMKKWCRKMFFSLLEVSIVTLYLFCVLVQKQFSKRPVTHWTDTVKLIGISLHLLVVDRPRKLENL